MKYNIYHKSPIFGLISIDKNVDEEKALRMKKKFKSVVLQKVKSLK